MREHPEPCWKQSWKTKVLADRAIKGMKSHRRKRNLIVPEHLWAYQCNDCGLWHLN